MPAPRLTFDQRRLIIGVSTVLLIVCSGNDQFGWGLLGRASGPAAFASFVLMLLVVLTIMPSPGEIRAERDARRARRTAEARRRRGGRPRPNP